MLQVIPGAVNVVAAAANGATASGGSSSGGGGGVVSSGGLNPNASVFRCSKETARDSSTFDTPPPPTTTSVPQLQQQQLSPDVTANVNTNMSSETPYVTGTMAYTPESGGAGVDTSSMRDNDDDVGDAAQQLWQPEAPVQQQLTNGSVMTSSTDAGDGTAAAAAVAESDGKY